MVGGHPTGTSKIAFQPLDSRFGDSARSQNSPDDMGVYQEKSF
jgi:hypothetical protein